MSRSWRRHGRGQRLRPDQFDLDARLNRRREAAEGSDGEQSTEQDVEAERDREAGFAKDANRGAGTLHARINHRWSESWACAVARFPVVLERTSPTNRAILRQVSAG